MARTYGVVVCGYLNATSHYTRVNVTNKVKLLKSRFSED